VPRKRTTGCGGDRETIIRDERPITTAMNATQRTHRS